MEEKPVPSLSLFVSDKKSFKNEVAMDKLILHVYIFKTFYYDFPEKLRNLTLLRPPSNALSSARQARAVTEVGESSNEEPQIDYEGQWLM